MSSILDLMFDKVKLELYNFLLFMSACFSGGQSIGDIAQSG